MIDGEKIFTKQAESYTFRSPSFFDYFMFHSILVYYIYSFNLKRINSNELMHLLKAGRRQIAVINN